MKYSTIENSPRWVPIPVYVVFIAKLRPISICLPCNVHWAVLPGEDVVCIINYCLPTLVRTHSLPFEAGKAKLRLS